MSAESQNHTSLNGGHVVSPQPMSDKSIIESVAGFINDVVPQGYASGPVAENKEQITWARFEYGDINDPVLYPDSRDDHNNTAPLLLVLGYGSGVQVWAIPASGEATEVLSWRQGTVRTLRVLPTPAAEHGSSGTTADIFAHKRPLVALCDSSSPGAQFCSVSFISLRAGDQVKSIKFKNPVNDVLANRRSVIVTFSERIAVFDASTLEDRLTITTCYPSPGPNPNPVALGSRWLAYAERRLIPSKRCSGGTEGEGVQSYTAAVLHAAKTLGKGLRGLGETVASSLTGGASLPAGRTQPSVNVAHPDCEALCPGVVTVVDVKGSWKENGKENEKAEDNVVAHFTGHGDAIVALQFDPSGMLLLTADKRGHDFHLFRIHPHPGGSTLAAVHHLYVLHRGDTTAKVQDIAFAGDSRWVAVSTLRGTTHVFPMTPYGGGVGLRTHSTPHVVNRLSRFHRSAGLSADGRNSPQGAAAECPLSQSGTPYANPRLPPYPLPTTVAPLAQIRQMTFMSSAAGAAAAAAAAAAPGGAGGQAYQSYQPCGAYQRNPAGKGAARNHVAGEDAPGVTLRVSACFAPSRAWLVGSPTVARDSSTRALKKPVESLFVMACHGNLVEYELDTKHATGIPKEKLCDDTAIELEVTAKARWLLTQVPPSVEAQPPLAGGNLLLAAPPARALEPPPLSPDERWLSHVEIVTHAGPHRRLWMGPQFTFKIYSPTAGEASGAESESVEIGCGNRLARSNPVNMPMSAAGRAVVPFLIESGSAGSYEQSTRLVELYGGSAGDSDSSVGVVVGETQLREELADAMMESPGRPPRDAGRRVIVELRSQTIAVEKIVNPVGSVLTVVSDQCLADESPVDGDCTDAAVRWPSDLVKPDGKCAAAAAATVTLAHLPADRKSTSLAHDFVDVSAALEANRPGEEPETGDSAEPPKSNADGAAGRKNAAASDADIGQSKGRGEKARVRKLKSGDKVARAKPASIKFDSIDSVENLREKTPEKAPPAFPSRRASYDAARLAAAEVAAQTAREVADAMPMTDSKTEDEYITPKPVDVFDADLEHLLDEVSANSEDCKPLERVSKSKLYPIDAPEISFQCDVPMEIDCAVVESDLVDECDQDLNKVSFNCSQEDDSWAPPTEPLSDIDFVEQSPEKLWCRVESDRLECEKLVDEISDEIADEIAPSWVQVNDQVVAEAMEETEVVTAAGSMACDRDPDTLTLLQNSKKNKKKNKRRR